MKNHEASTEEIMSGSKPMLHFMCGKMAAGKSTLARKIAAQQEAILICEDLWLSRLYPDEIKSFDDYLQCAARLKGVVAPHVVDLLRQGISVILDFPGNTPNQRAWFRGIVEAAEADHLLHFPDVPDAMCKTQLQKRNHELPEGSQVMTEEEFELVTSYFVPPAEEEGFHILRYPVMEDR